MFPNKSIISTTEYENMKDDIIREDDEEMKNMTDAQMNTYNTYPDRFKLYIKILNEMPQSFTDIDFVKSVYKHLDEAIHTKISFIEQSLIEQNIMGIFLANKEYMLKVSPTFKLLDD